MLNEEACGEARMCMDGVQRQTHVVYHGDLVGRASRGGLRSVGLGSNFVNYKKTFKKGNVYLTKLPYGIYEYYNLYTG